MAQFLGHIALVAAHSKVNACERGLKDLLTTLVISGNWSLGLDGLSYISVKASPKLIYFISLIFKIQCGKSFIQHGYYLLLFLFWQLVRLISSGSFYCPAELNICMAKLFEKMINTRLMQVFTYHQATWKLPQTNMCTTAAHSGHQGLRCVLVYANLSSSTEESDG